MYSIILCLQYLLRRRLTILSTIGVLLGVGTLVVTLAVMSGFLKEIRKASRGGLSDVIIESDIAGFPYYDELADEIRKHPNVVDATPVVQLFGLARISADPHTRYAGAVTSRVSVIIGVRPDEFARVSQFTDFVTTPTDTSPETGQPLPPDFEVDDEVVLRMYRRLQPYLLVSRMSDDELLMLFRSSLRLSDDLERDALIDRMRQWIEEEHLGGDSPVGCIPGIELVSYDPPEVSQQVDPNSEKLLLADIGSEIVLTTLPITSSGDLDTMGRNVSPQMGAYTIVNHFKSRLYEFDQKNIYIPFTEAQRLGRLGETPTELGTMAPARASQLLIRLKDYGQARESISEFRQIYAQLRPGDPYKHRFLTFSTWEEKQAMILGVVQMQRNLMIILLGLIILVAGFLIGATLSMIVKEKTRDIGIMKSLGASDTGVAGIFLLYGFIIGAVGSVLGLVAGLVFVARIDRIADFLSSLLGYPVFPPQAYGFDRIPRDVDPVANATVVIGAILVAVCCSAVAAWRASRMQPVEALRYE